MDDNLEFGPYHRLYETNDSLWQNHVGLLVREFVEEVYTQGLPGTALDLGAGEGDNAIFFAKNGWRVHMAEISPAAVKCYQKKASSYPHPAYSNITVHTGNVEDQHFGIFDLVVAYGLLHCFQSKDKFLKVAELIKTQVKPKGYVIVCSLTEQTVSRDAHPELVDNFIPTESDINDCFKVFDIIKQEIESFMERHGEGPEHQHRVYRAIYRNK